MEIKKECLECKKVFVLPRPKYKPNAKYCSAICRQRGVSKATAVERGNKLRGIPKGKILNGSYYPMVNGVHEHRLVMEKFLGRKLTKTEIVHHAQN